jgi:hypothetical protein
MGPGASVKGSAECGSIASSGQLEGSSTLPWEGSPGQDLLVGPEAKEAGEAEGHAPVRRQEAHPGLVHRAASGPGAAPGPTVTVSAATVEGQ